MLNSSYDNDKVLPLRCILQDSTELIRQYLNILIDSCPIIIENEYLSWISDMHIFCCQYMWWLYLPCGGIGGLIPGAPGPIPVE